jgi:2,4-dienoyl-CoA reductase-like NADH-dependent reductase (Old Yellow Enzyme family)
MSLLFQPLQFGTLRLSNKIIIAPMCQYSATLDGKATFWHQQQWANYALSGAGLCIVEATAVQAVGRISPADLGLWQDEQAALMKTLLTEIKAISPMPFAVQLAHAGRKASTDKPWSGKGQLRPEQQNGWQTVSASELAFNCTDHPPHALSHAEIKQVIHDFAAAAKRAVYAGFDLIELHAAHGYLLHQFMSPLSNQREDDYGGDLDARIGLTLAVFDAMKAVVPENYPIGVRISATDWMGEQAWDIADSIYLAEQLEAHGAVYIHVSSGGLDPKQNIGITQNYQVPFAHAIKQKLNIPVIAVGLITQAEQAENILKQQQADAVGIGRAISYDPRWPWHAAAELGDEISISPQYLRCAPHGLNDRFHAF